MKINPTKLFVRTKWLAAVEWVCQWQFLLSPYNNRKWQFLCGVIISELVSTDKVQYRVNSCTLHRHCLTVSLSHCLSQKCEGNSVVYLVLCIIRSRVNISVLFHCCVLSFINIARILFSILFCKKSTKHLYKKLNLILRNGKTKSN